MPVARRLEAESLVIGNAQVFGPQHRRHLHRQIRSGATGYIVDLHLHRNRCSVDQLRATGRVDTSFVHRQAEFFHPELAGVGAAAIGLVQGDAVQTQLGGARNGKTALSALPARGRLSPGQGLGIFLTAAQMRQYQARWW